MGEDHNDYQKRTLQLEDISAKIDWANVNYISLLQYNLTDAGNAEIFRDAVGNIFCYVPELGCWLKFDGVKWIKANEEAKLTMLAIIRKKIDIAQIHLTGKNEENQRQKIIKHSLASESSPKLKSAIEIAQAMLTKNFSEFDKDPYLLCLENGVFDLRVGGEGFRKSRSDDYLYKCTHVEYIPGAKCPRWEQFLEEVTCKDKETIRFKQKAYGYTLTGNTSEQCLFFCHGAGANGKSTELDIPEKLLGDYAITTPASTFKEQHGSDGIPNDIARMAGMRLVKTVEIKEGIRFNEERIKALTGQDIVSARFLHKEWFDYRPQYKIWMAANHKPVIKGTDEAIWRRIRLIPFEAYFPPEKRDPDLLNTLHSELPGILLWAIEGCYFWQREGLMPPEKVKKATSEYREESDVVGKFLDECTITGEFKKVRAGELWEAYEKWCGGKADIYQKAFGLKIAERGFIRTHSKGYPYYLGMGLKND